MLERITSDFQRLYFHSQKLSSCSNDYKTQESTTNDAKKENLKEKKDLALVPTVLGDCALGSKFKKIDIPAKIAMVNGLTLVKVLLTLLKRIQVRAC